MFGRGRPATGFSADLKALYRVTAGGRDAEAAPGAIAAPWQGDAALRQKIDALRAAGETVVWLLPGHEQDAADMGCDRQLSATAGGDWRIDPL